MLLGRHSIDYGGTVGDADNETDIFYGLHSCNKISWQEKGGSEEKRGLIFSPTQSI